MQSTAAWKSGAACWLAADADLSCLCALRAATLSSRHAGVFRQWLSLLHEPQTGHCRSLCGAATGWFVAMATKGPGMLIAISLVGGENNGGRQHAPNSASASVATASARTNRRAFVLLHTRAKTNALQQQGNQFSLAAHTRFRKDVSQVHTRRGAPNAQFLAAIFQR